jgi:ChaB
MPKTTKSGLPRSEELPGMLKRSPEKAKRTFAKAYDSAVENYGDEERGPPGRLQRGQAPVREGRRPLGAEGPPGSLRRQGGESQSAGEPRPVRRRRRHQGQLQEGTDGPGRQARHPRPLEDDKQELGEAIARKQD